MSRINIYHGAFAEDRHEVVVEGGRSIRDALPRLDISNSVILVNGFRCDGNRILGKDDVCDIRILPEGGGGNPFGGWNFIDTIMTVFTGGLWAVGSLITAACCGKTWGKLLWDPQLEVGNVSSQSMEQTQQVPYISGAQNQSLQGKPIPFIMGRHLLNPYYCGNSYTQLAGEDGDEQYMYMLFMLGYSKLKVSDIKIGDQVLARNPGNILNGYIPVDNNDMLMYQAEIEVDQTGKDLALYPQTVYEEQLQIELLNTNRDRVFKNEPKRFSGRNPMRVEVEIYMPTLMAYDDEGNKKSASVSVSVMYRWSTLDGSTEWQPFAAFNGNNGYSNGKSTITRSKAKNMRFVASKSFAYSDIPRLDGDLYPSAKIEIKVARESANPTDNKVQSQVYLSGIRTWSYDYEASKARRMLVPEKPVSQELMDVTARMAIKIKASEDLSGQIKSINCVLQSYARTWDGAQWTTEESPTSNPASICLKALQSNMLGDNKKSDDEIDLAGLGRIYEFCEDNHRWDTKETNEANTRGCKLECNGVLSSTSPLRDLIGKILAAGRSVMTNDFLKFSAIYDGARSQYVTILNNQNVLKATNTKNFDKVVDGFKVKFIDETDNWQENVMFVNFDDGTTVVRQNYEYEEISMTYCTHRDQVWHNAMFEGAKRMYRKEIWNRTLSVDGAMLQLFDLVQVQDDTLVVGIGDGAEIRGFEYDYSGNYITAIHTDGRFNVNDLDRQYGIKIMQADGVNTPSIRVAKVVIPEEGLHASFRLESPIYMKEAIVPSVGDIVAFGEYDRETINAFVLEKKPAGDGTYDVTLMPYSDDVFRYEKNRIMPVFDSKINPPQPPAGIREMPQSYPSFDDLNGALNYITSGTESTVPDVPQMLVAVAEVDGIRISWVSGGMGIANSIRHYIIECSKGHIFTQVGMTSATEWLLLFSRPQDGYPEADELDRWRIRVKAVNVYGKESGWSQEAAPSTDTYGTWILAAPKVAVQVRDRHVTLLMSQPPRADGRKVYGDVRNAVTIRRPDIDTDAGIWYTPGASLNPYPETAGDGTVVSNEGNYRLDTTVPEYRAETYVQTLPLKGQGAAGSGLVDTLYLFRVVAASEAGESPASTVQAVALCTNIVDLVQANITQKEAYVPDLSAISANLGSINQGGMGNDNNRWDLSTFVDPRGVQRWEGLFRVGGSNQYLHVNPIISDIGQIIDYEIIFRVGKFELSSTASSIKGEVIVMADDRPWERTRITPTGTYYEYLPSQEAGWQTVAKQETRGLMSQLMYSGQSIILTNSSITQRRRNGIDLGRPYLSGDSLVYHFDEDFLDQHGNRGYTLEGQAQLVDMDDNTPLVPIDFTAAILSVAPYSEVGKSAYGKFSLTHPLGSSNVFTVDFWIQYIWAENQVLLDIGVPSDRIQIICSSGEPNYNEPQDGEPPYNWEVEAADRLPYNVAAGSAVYANHQGIGSFDTIDLEDIGFEFTPNTWEHLAVVLTDTEITLYLRDRRLPFTRWGTGIQEATAVLNAGAMSFQLDELLVDTTAARDFADFVDGTHDKVPWAALDHRKKHYILDAAEPDNITGNLFTSRAFERAVLRVLDNNKETL